VNENLMDIVFSKFLMSPSEELHYKGQNHCVIFVLLTITDTVPFEQQP